MTSVAQCLGVGFLWLALMLAFEIAFGRFVFRASLGASGVGLRVSQRRTAVHRNAGSVRRPTARGEAEGPALDRPLS